MKLKKTAKFVLKKVAPGYHDEIVSRNYLNTLPKAFQDVLKELEKDTIAIDIGANIGLVTLILSQKCRVVHAFEPNEQALNELEKKAARNKNIIVHRVAAGTKYRQQQLYLRTTTQNSEIQNTQSSSLHIEKPNVSDDVFQVIEEIDFADFLKSLNCYVDIIKVDIEGYEIPLVNHMLDTCDFDRIGKIFVETHENSWPAIKHETEQMIERVETMGLSCKFNFDWI